MSRLRLTLLALVAVAALLFTACGGDDDDVSADDSSGDDASGDQDTGDDDSMAASAGGDCGFLLEFADSEFGAFDPSELFTAEEPVDLGDVFAPIAAQFTEVADAAPAEISDAFQVMAEAISGMASELDGVVFDPSDPEGMDPETMAKLAALGETFDNEEVTAASEEIEAWLESNCADLADQFDLGGLGG